MDWYFGNHYDDLVVPKDRELLDMIPSPDVWLKWGINDAEGDDYGSDEKYFVSNSKINNEEMNADGKSSYNEYGGLLEGHSRKNTVSHGHHDNLVELEQMDDIFLSSVLRDLPGNEDPNCIFHFSSESQSDMITGDDTLTNSSLQFIPCELDPSHCPPFKVLFGKASVPSEKDSNNGNEEGESSPEGSVLHELQMVTEQLPEKTRICFRDALFRLAQNSKQQIIESQDRDLGIEKMSWTYQDETTRKRGPTEAKTNTIDRAIANLMFNIHDLPVATPANSDEELFGRSKPRSHVQVSPDNQRDS